LFFIIIKCIIIFIEKGVGKRQVCREIIPAAFKEIQDSFFRSRVNAYRNKTFFPGITASQIHKCLWTYFLVHRFIMKIFHNPFSTMEVSLDKTPRDQELTNIQWQNVKADANGLVNIGRYHARQGRAPDVVFCRTNVVVEKDTLMELKYGYSDAIVLFLNDTPLAYGSSAYRERDPSFLGIIGLYDAIYLPLKKGNNELLLAVAESFGGWGFMCHWGNAVWTAENITRAWETEESFKVAESVLYDPEREVLYVTNFDQFNMGNPDVSQSISKISLEGEILEPDWVSNLTNPLGMTIYNDQLIVAERKHVVRIDLGTGEVKQRTEVLGSLFLNDVATDEDGNIYVSDSRKNVIWKITGDQVEEWLTGEDVLDPNVLYFYKGKLLFGNSGVSWLKTVNLTNKNITKIARFPEGFIDGIRADGHGNLLVSLWKGKIYAVNPEGEISLILHTENKGEYSADFEYIPEKRLLIVPTFYGNKVVGYQY